MREEREDIEAHFFSFFLDSFFLMKYLENRKSKLRTIFIFEILASRSLKLDPVFRFRDIYFFVLPILV
jgi:hypothetical protein